MLTKTIYDKGRHEAKISVCCKRMANAEDIGFQDKEWTIFAEGQYLYRNIKYCPFCGTSLQNPPVIIKEEKQQA